MTGARVGKGCCVEGQGSGGPAEMKVGGRCRRQVRMSFDDAHVKDSTKERH